VLGPGSQREESPRGRSLALRERERGRDEASGRTRVRESREPMRPHVPSERKRRRKEWAMRRILTFRGVIGVAVFLIPLLAGADEPRKITVVAKKYEFNPSRIELKAGEPVEITFESEDTKHGFSVKELDVEKVTFQKGQPATVKFTPSKPGTYAFKCAKFCGMGHGKMKGEIVVTE
jgi:cytochrome c oxidase subunit 2